MRSVMLISAGAAALVAAPAAARDGAWYIGGDFGGMIVEDSHVDFNSSAKVDLDHDTGLDAGMFVGYDLGAFRLEAEVDYKRASLDELGTNFTIPPPAGPASPGSYKADGHTSALSFMVNGMLDFGDDEGLGGFVGGGVGVARVNFNNVRVFANSEPYLDDGDSRFAWQVVAGIRHPVSDRVDVTLKYRFFNVSGLRFEDIGGFVGDSGVHSHSLLAGVTFNFGAPPPPPDVPTTVPQPPLAPAETLQSQQ